MKVGSQFAQYINPLLAALKSLGGSARAAEARAAVADLLLVDDSVLEERLASGQSRFDNQVGWARYYLVRAGYIDSSRRGVWALTKKGRGTENLSDAEISDLVRSVIAEWGRKSEGSDDADSELSEERPPDEIPMDYRAQLLAILKDLPAAGFERLCQRLLREADFEQVTVTGRSGDGGIDGIGILQLNPFVSFKVLFQCKRYAGGVGPSMVRDFRGAMMGRADKGLILTTGSFTAEARREAVRDGVPPIELVDGQALVDLFEKLELGLHPRSTFDVNESFIDEFRK
ncbi:MAG TPA: restriction endonuclease [Acidobacteriota bacterium]|nr:restriction endonuclease [Acidobacteriota bacterium]